MNNCRRYLKVDQLGVVAESSLKQNHPPTGHLVIQFLSNSLKGKTVHDN